QILHVVARDLSERTVIGSMIIAADHQPVALIRIAQHRVGDGHEVWHLSRHCQAQWRRRSRCRLPAASRAASVATLLGATTSLSTARRGGRRLLTRDDENARHRD